MFTVVSEKSLQSPKSRRFSPMFSSRSFIVLHLMFRALIHSELIFVYGVRIMAQLHSFACGYPVFPAPFVEETVLSPLSGLSTFVGDH